MAEKRSTPETRFAFRVGFIGGFVCGLLIGWGWLITGGNLVLLVAMLMLGLIVATVHDFPRNSTKGEGETDG